MSTAVQVKHHADQRFAGPAFSMLAAGRRFFGEPRRLKCFFDEGVAAGNAVRVPEFFVKVSDIKTVILGSV